MRVRFDFARLPRFLLGCPLSVSTGPLLIVRSSVFSPEKTPCTSSPEGEWRWAGGAV